MDSLTWCNLNFRLWCIFNFRRHRKDIERDLIEIKNVNEPAFKASLYNHLKEKDIESKAKFLSICIQYETLFRRLKIPKYIQNPQEFFIETIINTFGLQLTEEELDVNEIIKENLSKWSQEVSFQIDEKIKQSKTINSLLLFGEFYAATEEAERIIEEANANRIIRVAGSEIEYEQISDINAELDELRKTHKTKIIKASTSKVKAGKSKSKSTTQTRRTYSKKNTKDIGYSAEYLAYHQLVDEYGEESVEWVSENAVKAGVNMEGGVGKGYDILLKVNGIERFVEVKALISPSIGFGMSNNELKTALDNPERYDIFIVQSITENPEYLHIEGFFDIPKKQKLSNNDKFTIYSDSVTIKFNLEDFR